EQLLITLADDKKASNVAIISFDKTVRRSTFELSDEEINKIVWVFGNHGQLLGDGLNFGGKHYEVMKANNERVIGERAGDGGCYLRNVDDKYDYPAALVSPLFDRDCGNDRQCSAYLRYLETYPRDSESVLNDLSGLGCL
ncbi:hypothetical protein PENTCL1PPCAC_15203, partial [Pristionchus entomophagus]